MLVSVLGLGEEIPGINTSKRRFVLLVPGARRRATSILLVCV